MNSIPEKDWKIARELKQVALERMCSKIISQAEDICQKADISKHKSYLELYEHILESDKEIAFSFDDFKRSTAIIQILTWKRCNLINDEEFAQFSTKTQEQIKDLLSFASS